MPCSSRLQLTLLGGFTLRRDAREIAVAASGQRLIALLALYGIVRAAGEAAWLGVVAVAIYAADPLSFFQGRLGMLDIMVTAAMLVAAWLALRGRWAWSGVALGIATLIKLTGALGLLALVLMQIVIVIGKLIRREPVRRADVTPMVVIVAVYGVVFIGGLWVLDLAFTSFRTPWDHLLYMIRIGRLITGSQLDSSQPWQWLLDVGQFDFVGIDPRASTGVQPTSLVFRAAVNPLLLLALPFALVYVVWITSQQGNRSGLWSLSWLAGTYLPLFGLMLANRTMYLYYMTPIVPALVVMVALLFMRSRLPRWVAAMYVAASWVAFALYFPFWGQM